MEEVWHFDPENRGNSFYNGYGLTDAEGRSIGIHIETGRDLDDEKQQQRGRLAALAPALRTALINLEAEICSRFPGDWQRAPEAMTGELKAKVLAAREVIKKAA